MEEKRLALLIDAENTSVRFLDAIITELKSYGVITYQHMYGDFSGPNLAEWHKKALKYAIVPIQQPRYSTGKNAADIMLVIDAMDILYKGKVDGFCIVTSDSDFTRLVSRIREEGMFVVGMGKSDASKSFVAACNEYKFLDKIVDEEVKAPSKESSKAKNAKAKTADTDHNHDGEETSITPISEIKSAINNMIQQSENVGEHANLGSVKSNLQRLFPDFDERNYGYSSMRTFIEEATKFETMQKGTTIQVLRSSDHDANVEPMVREFIIRNAKGGIELALLGNMIVQEFPDFKYKDYGYARLSRYVSSISGVSVKNNMVSLVK